MKVTRKNPKNLFPENDQQKQRQGNQNSNIEEFFTPPSAGQNVSQRGPGGAAASVNTTP